MQLNEGHKRAILQMFAHGTSIRALADWYHVDQHTIREVLRPHVKMGVESGRAERVSVPRTG